MNKDTMKQYALPLIAIGAILILAGGYQAVNPVLAVSAHDDRAEADMQRMLATTTFAVEGFDPTVTISGAPTGSVQEGTTVNITCTWDYDGYPAPGGVHLIHSAPTRYEMMPSPPSNTGTYTFHTTVPLVSSDQTLASFRCSIDAWGQRSQGDGEPDTVASTPTVRYTLTNSVPIIDDDTDTLTLDKTTYRPGETVSMTAWAENVGGETWSGEVTFTVLDPPGREYTMVTTEGVTVAAGASEIATNSFELPPNTGDGVWSIQSKWIHDDGTIHAMSTIDLGTATVAGIDINALGCIGVLVGLLLGGLGLRGRGII